MRQRDPSFVGMTWGNGFVVCCLLVCNQLLHDSETRLQARLYKVSGGEKGDAPAGASLQLGLGLIAAMKNQMC